MSKAIVVGINSTIGAAIAESLAKSGWQITGTTRSSTYQPNLEGVRVISECDMSSKFATENTLSKILELNDSWDALIVTPGTMLPIGNFTQLSFDSWEESIAINFTNQLRLVHGLLRNAKHDKSLQPCVMMFAGGGTNSAPESFSAYTVSKIALIKMVELLDAENPDFRFTILGPGWVRSKIHQETLNSPHTPKKTRDETMRRLECDDFIPLNKVVETIKWLLAAPKSVIGGRNFSAAHDPFQNEYFANRLLDGSDILKLRRFGNDYSWMSDAD